MWVRFPLFFQSLFVFFVLMERGGAKSSFSFNKLYSMKKFILSVFLSTSSVQKFILLVFLLTSSVQKICNKNHKTEYKIINTKEILLLAKLIQSECGNCPIKDKELVGASVINRMNAPEFPNTMEKVIFQKNQYYFNKNIKVDSFSIKTAKKILKGHHNRKIKYFWNHKSKGFRKKPKIITKYHNYS